MAIYSGFYVGLMGFYGGLMGSNGISDWIYPLVICYIAIENDHLVRGFTH